MRKTRNTLTIQIFYFLRDGCRDDTSITTNLVSIVRLERVEINLLGFFLLLFQVKLFVVGHDSFYDEYYACDFVSALSRVKKREKKSVVFLRRGKSEMSVNV